MNKTKIKNFAIGAREKLIADITYKAGLLGITDSGIAEELPQSTADLKFFDIGTKEYAKIKGKEIKQREAFVKAIREKEDDCGKYKDAFEFVVEEVAYTWFNRMIAIRFMEVNDYLPSGIRVLSSENKAKLEPDFVTTPFETDLEFTQAEQDYIINLKDENKLDELFRMLFIKQCNKLNEILPELFENTDDYTELLLTISFTDKDGIVYKLTHDVDEDDFNVEKEGQVEIIGWMYQYYISAKHDQIINIYKGTIKKDDIPAATQLFTTDWVVRYMVDNSLGRYWIERNPKSNLAEKLEFFVKPKDGHINYIDEKVEPTELTFFDPCMGSGHILVYAFDVLMEIYRECGYTDRDAAKSIIENNIYGLDIDKRAYHLAYFAIMMKARSYDRRILTRGVSSNLTNIEESNNINKFTCENLTKDEEQNKIGEYLIKVYKHAREYGSLQFVELKDYNKFKEYLNSLDTENIDTFSLPWVNNIRPLMYKLVKQAEIMSKRYAVVCTNPPYMNKFEGHLKDFIQENFKDYKGDLFSAFMFRNFGYCKKDGYSAFMTPFVWMFIKTYEQLREYIISQKAITSLIQMEYSTFEEATVPICSFVLKNGGTTEKALCFRLSDFKGGMEVQKQKVIEAIESSECNYFYESDQANFSEIPGSPVAYWLSESAIDAFKAPTLSAKYDARNGITTGENDLFLRYWYEVGPKKEKWFKCNKGGAFRRWYGNQDFVIDWENDGFRLKNFRDAKGKQRSTLRSIELNFKEAITMSRIGSGKSSFRYLPAGFITEGASNNIYGDADRYSLLAFLNSKACNYILDLYNPTINVMPEDLKKLPLTYLRENVDFQNDSKECIDMCKQDWDAFENSWDFKRHPLVRAVRTVQGAYSQWEEECNIRFRKLKHIEEKLNSFFIEIYGLQNELTSKVDDKDITVRQANLQRDIRSFISYAVGCMLGRYSLDVDGLAYAGGEWDNSKYTTFIPDADNCIPLTDEEYFEDDIVGRFVKFIEVVYGKQTLEENLNFIADALGNKGKTSREVIRNYFLNDFIKDHIKKYQKRPIYWLFDSGKQNGFKALVYMHRWNEDTVGHLRVEYLHKMQRVYEKEIERMQEIIDNSKDNKEVSASIKRKEKLQKQLKETKDYDAKIAHIALSRIDIDLDDGVKVNYDKVQTVDGKNMQILAKI